MSGRSLEPYRRWRGCQVELLNTRALYGLELTTRVLPFLAGEDRQRLATALRSNFGNVELPWISRDSYRTEQRLGDFVREILFDTPLSRDH